MLTPDTFRRSLRLAPALALGALVLLAPAGSAQTPEAAAGAAGDGPHPGHIHAGTCAELGEVVAPLTDAAAPEGEHTGAASAHGVQTSRTMVDMPLEEIIAGGHAINFHESADAIDVYIACGDIGGVLVEEGGRTHLVIGLGELNDSGHAGVAWLGSDGDQTEVVVTLIEPDEMDDDD